ncbi:helix-turn-helix transcriptional regulator [Methanosarcina sp. UBA5]|uniref:helix-turn-helix transcriptional regulator n=1 Tax=Methanosarcina sp. UBA5 TaxID=1915593 RepID=UPI0025E5EC65|nr:winged helix-turn-helix domain-containing protein [Methanosarcina sp. UBA5]
MKHCLLNLILFSGRRKDILLLLKEKPRDVDEIKELLSVNASSIQLHMKKMKESGLITQKNKIYRLSEIGEIIVENMQPLLSTAELLGENTEYWLSHDLSSIPEFLLKRIDELGHCELLEPDAGHLFETPKILRDSILSSREVLTFAAYFHPQAPAIYTEITEKGAEIILCMTESVAHRLFLNNRKEAEKLSRASNSRLFIVREPTAVPSLIVTDRLAAFKLFEKNGKLRDQLVLSFGEKAICWGKELFRYYLEAAEPLDENEFL